MTAIETPCVLPNKFVAGAIISKLPHSCRDFAMTLKHKRQVFMFDELVTTLDVEETERAKDTHGNRVLEPSSTNFVQRGYPKSNPKPQNKMKKPKKTHQWPRKPTWRPTTRRKVPARCAGVRTTLLQCLVAKIARSLPTWLLVRLEEQRGMVTIYLQFF
jgi:hypothetical protein